MLISIVHTPGWGYEVHCACMPEERVLRERSGDGKALQALVQKHADECLHRVDGVLRPLEDDEVRRLQLEPGKWFTDDELRDPRMPPFKR